jgi:hypothetical protein
MRGASVVGYPDSAWTDRRASAPPRRGGQRHEGESQMVKIAVRYTRYVASMLASVGFVSRLWGN